MPTLYFKGKTFLQNYHHTIKFHRLIEHKAKGLNDSPSLNDNLVIHGDNLKALKALLPTHAGKIKCIYIDPPYNTGNENWIYNDNVASPMIQEWLGKVVNRDDLTRHDKWCCMMYPRLTLLRELLKDDGAIFISIDDNEVHHLRMIMDEIFGEENFVTQLTAVNNLKGNNDEYGFSGTHEYVLIYTKTLHGSLFYEHPISDEEMNDWEEDDYGYFKKGANLKSTGQNAPREKRPNLYYPIYIANNKISLSRTSKSDVELLPHTEGKEMSWRWSKEKITKQAYDLLIEKNVLGEISVYKKQRPQLGELPTKKPKTTFYKPEYSSGNGTHQLKQIFGEKIFDTPKSLIFIRDLIRTISVENDIILDSFAGSGTTGHAVLNLNKEDGANRKFILIECEEYADKITAERLRRVIKGVPTTSDDSLKQGLGGSFSYFELGEEINIDNLLEGKNLPSFEDLAKYAFFTATGEQFQPLKMDEKSFHIGSSSTFEVFLMYSTDKNKLKNMALNLDFAEKIHNKFPTRPKLIFAPACFMEDYHLKEFNIRFAQLPFEIYRMAE